MAKLGVNVRPTLEHAVKILGPEIEARRKQIELHGEKWDNKPVRSKEVIESDEWSSNFE